MTFSQDILLLHLLKDLLLCFLYLADLLVTLRLLKVVKNRMDFLAGHIECILDLSLFLGALLLQWDQIWLLVETSHEISAPLNLAKGVKFVHPWLLFFHFGIL